MSTSLWSGFLRTWKHHFVMQFATLAVLAGTYTVVTLALLAHHNLNKILSAWGQKVQISAYLNDSVDAELRLALSDNISALKGVEKLSFLSKDAAAKVFADQMSDYAPEFLAELKYGNPLPASFEIKVMESLRESGSMELLNDLVKKISELNGVEDVSYGQGWVENYASLVSGFSNTGWLVVLILLTGSLFVVGNSIRSSINSRRDEIEILELFGATSSMIRGPYIFEGALMGLAAAVLSVGLCYLLYFWQAKLFSDSLGFLGLGQAISYLSIWKLLMMIFAGTALGALGSLICVRSISSGWAAAEAQDAWSTES